MQKLIVYISSQSNNTHDIQNVDNKPKNIYPVMYSSASDLKEKIDELINIHRENLGKAHEITQKEVFPLHDEMHRLMSDRGVFGNFRRCDTLPVKSYTSKSDDDKKAIDEKIQEKEYQIRELNDKVDKLRDSFVLVNGTNIDLSDIAPHYSTQFDSLFFIYTLDEWFDITLKAFEKLPETD